MATVSTDPATKEAFDALLDGIKERDGVTKGVALAALVPRIEALVALDGAPELESEVQAIARSCGAIQAEAKAMAGKYAEAVGKARSEAEEEASALRERVGELEGKLAESEAALGEARAEAAAQRAAAERAQATLDAVLGLRDTARSVEEDG